MSAYKLYKCFVREGNIIILAKRRLYYRRDPNKFLEGLCLGFVYNEGAQKIPSKWQIGYYTRNWGSRSFKLLKDDEQFELRSKNNIIKLDDGEFVINTKFGVWSINKERIKKMGDKLDIKGSYIRKLFSEYDIEIIDRVKIKNN